VCRTLNKIKLNNVLGQRYDVIINANQTASNYWARISLGTQCGGNNILEKPLQLGAILHYEGADNAEPTTTGVEMRNDCIDETNLVPFVPNTVPSSIVPTEELAITSKQDNSTDNLFRWFIDDSTHVVNWSQPSLKTTLENGVDYGNNSNIYEIETKDNVSAGTFETWLYNANVAIVVSMVDPNSHTRRSPPSHPSSWARFLHRG
jgi:hypothetical protein